ncbi:hypothetical protein ACFRMO_07805 [Streptomyces anulatus]|uniref:hypothetical protein n=1 Tax=Streptomyces anulatus TaxID=1892 RepID=UPI00369E99AA
MARRPIDPDAELDATAYVQNLLQDTAAPASPPPSAWTPPEPAPRRVRRPQGRSYGPDSLPGLADYFARACPPLSWAGGLEVGNRQALISVFSELRRDAGLTPDDCRALTDLYVRRLGSRRPTKPYVWDFKWQRYQLLASLRDTGITTTAEDFESWQDAAPTDTAADDAFTASWGTS